MNTKGFYEPIPPIAPIVLAALVFLLLWVLLQPRPEKTSLIDCNRQAIHYAAVGWSPEFDDCKPFARAQIVDISVWPDSVEISVNARAQFYAATLDVVGRSYCEEPPSAPGALNESGSFAGGCDSAIIRLDVSLLPDDLATMFRWQTLDASAYDSLFYNVVLRTGDSTVVLDTIPVAHPTDSLVWQNGVADLFYEVQAYARGWARGQSADGRPGPWTRFQYPFNVPLPLDMGPVTVDTISG